MFFSFSLLLSVISTDTNQKCIETKGSDKDQSIYIVCDLYPYHQSCGSESLFDIILNDTYSQIKLLISSGRIRVFLKVGLFCITYILTLYYKTVRGDLIRSNPNPGFFSSDGQIRIRFVLGFRIQTMILFSKVGSGSTSPGSATIWVELAIIRCKLQ